MSCGNNLPVSTSRTMRSVVGVFVLCICMHSSFAIDMGSWGSENFLTLGYDAFRGEYLFASVCTFLFTGFPDATGRDPGFTRPIFIFQSNSPSFFYTPDLGCVTSFTSTTVKVRKILELESESWNSFLYQFPL